MVQVDKIVVVSKRTALEELIERFNTRDQARFYLEHMGASFEEYQAAHDAYAAAITALRAALPKGVRQQFIERSYVPTFTFGQHDLVITLGPDGLIVNVAKYLDTQPLLAFNPDPSRIDGALIPFSIDSAPTVVRQAVEGKVALQHLTMARAELNDGQRLYAVNDLFIGQRTHVSARYQLRLGSQVENQSSSGIIVSTGAGSTGWFRSLLTGGSALAGAFSKDPAVQTMREHFRFDREVAHLYFVVREPFPSKTSQASLIFRRLDASHSLEIVSQMPANGVIFSDGIETDALDFNSGATARISVAEKKVHLVVDTVADATARLPAQPVATRQRASAQRIRR